MTYRSTIFRHGLPVQIKILDHVMNPGRKMLRKFDFQHDKADGQLCPSCSVHGKGWIAYRSATDFPIECNTHS